MTIVEKTVGGVIVLNVDGRIDSAAALVLDEKIKARVASHRNRILIDLSEVAYISSAGFRTLLRAQHSSSAAHGRLALCGISGKVRQLFELGGFIDLFTMGATQEEGIAAVNL